ncbi:glycosyltransferase family 2 protein [Oscillospiraceae bacterium HV4-5-C5C]|nr:glycosyltransferase family 2 protein [Oscillospiraceae bacterium HV4-5-C5C]
MLRKCIQKLHFIKQTSRDRKRFKVRIAELEKAEGSYSLNRNDRSEKIIVSLTSFPARFESLHLVIKSILCQTLKPDRLILYLDDIVLPEMLPESLTVLKKYGLEIEYRPCNIKPHKKYYYAMKEHPESIVVTIDDDIMYPNDLISSLYECHKKFENCIVATRSHRILFDADGKLRKYNDWKWTDENTYEPSMKLVATGCGGVLYPPHCMSDTLFNLELIQKLSLYADDLWLKVMQVLVHTPVVNCNQDIRKKRVVVDGSQEKSLNASNVHENMNDIYMRNLMKYFNLTEDNFEE